MEQARRLGALERRFDALEKSRIEDRDLLAAQLNEQRRLVEMLLGALVESPIVHVPDVSVVRRSSEPTR